MNPYHPHTSYLNALYKMPATTIASGTRQDGKLNVWQHRRSKQRQSLHLVPNDIEASTRARANEQRTEDLRQRQGLNLDCDNVVAGIIQLPSLIMLDDHLQVLLTTYGRILLLLDVRPAVWYWDATSSIVELWRGRRVHHFLIAIEALRTSRQLKLTEWCNKAATNRHAGDAAAHSYGRGPPGLTILEAMVC